MQLLLFWLIISHTLSCTRKYFKLRRQLLHLSSEKLDRIAEANFLYQADERKNIVVIAGFEAFNLQLYRDSATAVEKIVPSVKINVFTDVDIINNEFEVKYALDNAAVLFCSLLFDYNQIEWLKSNGIDDIPTKFCFESALELMSETKVGSFTMKGAGNKGPPAPVKALLNQFGSKREEDRLSGYLKLLKIGPTLLQFIPGKKSQDLKLWLTTYCYWNQGSIENIITMLTLLIKELNLSNNVNLVIKPIVERPASGLYHPDLDTNVDNLSESELNDITSSPKDYTNWYVKKHAWVNSNTPRVGLLLYRKHVISNLGYIPNLIKLMESNGIMPISIYINGVEAHTVVRDLFTTKHEIFLRKSGQMNNFVDSVNSESTEIDLIVNTIGFPLVGGPAGSMEAGRRIEVSQNILSVKNVPYIVAAPLLIQDTDSWQKNGVQGLQSVVLYSLPELDGAIETMVLGGLVGGDKIVLIPDRVNKLAARIHGHFRLRNSNIKVRKLSLLVYGFPPSVGSTGTAALLNVGRSLNNVLKRLNTEGYACGTTSFVNALNIEDGIGDKLIDCLRILSQQYVTNIRGESSIDALQSLVDKVGIPGLQVIKEEVKYDVLRAWIGKSMTSKLEKQWGALETYTGLGTSARGRFQVLGLQTGKIFIGVQPLLGIEGDPMRLLFERDLTPHPQYVAYYQWLNRQYNPHCLIHFGMHGTVEWLPGNSLGTTADSWPEILLGNVPHIYIYACNNPSESLLAKRRGFATIISHLVPPYSRASLYQELSIVKDLIIDYRNELFSVKQQKSFDILPILYAALVKAGLFTDLPYSGTEPMPVEITLATAKTQAAASIYSDKFIKEFSDYIGNVTTYLAVLENRLFSEGLYVLGKPLSKRQIAGYLDAIIDSGPNSKSPLTPEMNNIILNEVMTRKSISEIILQISSYTSAPTSKESGVDWIRDGFTSEDKFAWSILIGVGSNNVDLFSRINDWLSFQMQRLLRNWGSKEADDYITNYIAISASTPSSSASNDKNKGNSNLLDTITLGRKLLDNTASEMDYLIRAINGEYIESAPGGDIIRDGVSSLPTGRNIYSLDPYRIPSQLAIQRGKEAALLILKQHMNRNQEYPKTVAVTLWGLDTIKTKGESVGIILELIGAEVIREGTGRVVAFKLLPVEEIGHPRIDVLASLSGIFRDSFGNILDLLDDVIQDAADASNEDDSNNYIKKHVNELKQKGIDKPTARLFSNPPGEFGSMVNEQIGSGEWKETNELGNTWENRNSFSYGKGEKGTPRPEVLSSLLSKTDRIIQEIDSIEYGLTDIQEYFANTGALKKAAENNKLIYKRNNMKVDVSIIETFEKQVKPQELQDVLRMEYRSKLLNPKWSDAMIKEGASGVYEISGRMTTLIGWSSTADFNDQYVYNTACERYVLDDAMVKKMKELNPEAFRNIVKRMLEANGRDFWKPTEDVLMKLQDLYDDIEDEIEGV